jgi:hypothetical protein
MMRLPRVRFTVRRIMTAVAVAACILGGIRLQQLAAGYQERSSHFAHRMLMEKVGCYFDDVILDAAAREKSRRKYTDLSHRRYLRYQSLGEKYERAARYPWLPVEPDPPEPE